jgi:polysaccharide pyruvyl transferase WcaK-like protein
MAASQSPILVARALPKAGDYDQLLLNLQRRTGARGAVQAAGAINKSDETYYRSMGIDAAGGLADVLAKNPAPVISVRLHGAVQAILAGLPAIHLAYERKSWGAYEDLGLMQWLHDARRFDPELVAAQAAELQADPMPYWAALRERLPALELASERLDGSLRRWLRSL